MRKSTALVLTWLLLLTACASAPTALVQAICPAIPPLDQRPAAQEPSFTDRMQDFLLGKLPEDNEYSLSLPNAKLPTSPPAKP